MDSKRKLLSVLLLSMGVSVSSSAQNPRGAACVGAVDLVRGSNTSPYSVSGATSGGVEIAEPSGTCSFSINVAQFQRWVSASYLETWNSAPSAGVCGSNACHNQISVSITGPGITPVIDVLDGTGLQGPPASAEGTAPWAPATQCMTWMSSLPAGQCLQWTRTVVRRIDVSALTQNNSIALMLTVSNTLIFQGSSVYVAFDVGVPLAVDPTLELQTNNNGILTDPDALAILGTPVSGIAADGAARVVLRINADHVGAPVTLTLMNDQGQPSANPSADGIISTIQGTPAGAGQLQLTAVQTSLGPMAFAVYTPPIDFSRGGLDDSVINRYVSFQWQVGTPATVMLTASCVIWRPPVVLVHGLWGAPANWNSFYPFNIDPRFFIGRATYDFDLDNVTVVSPVYPTPVPLRVNTNALGFTANAPTVLTEVKETIVKFRNSFQAAAAQADIVAHSMGGVVMRTLEYLPGFTDQASWGVGLAHKLITIGTPHLGSQVAAQLLNGSNNCVRNAFATSGMATISSATVPDLNGSVTGGVGDLQPISPALLAIQPPNGHEVPTVLIAATLSTLNTVSLDSNAAPGVLRLLCGADFLAQNLTSTGWSASVFGESNDGIVSLTSQQDFTHGSFVQNGVIHSAGLEKLGFTGPHELALSNLTQIQAAVIAYLNTPILTVAAPFYKLP